MLYREDYTLTKAKKLINEEFEGAVPDVADQLLIKYYINDLKARLEKQDKQLEKYHNFFKTLQSFLKIGPTVFGGR